MGKLKDMLNVFRSEDLKYGKLVGIDFESLTVSGHYYRTVCGVDSGEWNVGSVGLLQHKIHEGINTVLCIGCESESEEMILLEKNLARKATY